MTHAELLAARDERQEEIDDLQSEKEDIGCAIGERENELECFLRENCTHQDDEGKTLIERDRYPWLLEEGFAWRDNCRFCRTVVRVGLLPSAPAKLRKDWEGKSEEVSS